MKLSFHVRQEREISGPLDRLRQFPLVLGANPRVFRINNFHLAGNEAPQGVRLFIVHVF